MYSIRPLSYWKSFYHIDENKDETVKWYKINYLRNEADAVFNDRLLALKAEQAKADKQLTIFD